MTPENLIKELERYREELTQIMKRFTHSGDGMFRGFHMNRDDDPRLRTIVIELIDLLNDSIPDNQYSSIIQNTYNGGYSQFFLSYSYKCVEDIVSTLDSIITRLKRNPDICNPKQNKSSSSEKPTERQNMIKPIEDLTELERRIIRHHILTYPHYTSGLSTLGLFNDVHQDESDAAIFKLVQYGYYNKPQHHSVSWTPDGYHRCQSYFKDEINNTHNKTETNKTIPYPDKITIQWLKLYVPHHFWFWLVSALLAAFLAGVFIGQSKLYHDLTTKKEDPTNLTTTQTPVPTTRENRTDKVAAPIKNDTLKK